VGLSSSCRDVSSLPADHAPKVKSFLSYEDASAFVQGRDPSSSAMSDNKPPRFYGVAVGRKPGVYTDWSEAEKAIKGWKMPKFKKFDTREEAEAFVRIYSGSTSTATSAPPEDTEAGTDEPPAKKAKTSSKPTSSKSTTKKGNGVVVVYTDGSSRGNGSSGAAAGVGVYFGPGDPRFVSRVKPQRRCHADSPRRNISERLKGEPQTNQRAELTAILRALESVDLEQDLEIRTDSKYSIQCVTEWYVTWERNGWMTRGGPVKNKDLVQQVREKLEEREAKGGRTQFIWVKGHAMDAGNIAADKLAVDGAMKPL
jgi:ribonuclease HI